MGTAGKMGGVKAGLLLAFVCLRAQGLDIDPHVVGIWPPHPYHAVRGVAVAGNAVYIARGDAGIEIVDFSNPAMPLHAQDLEVDGPVAAIMTSGDFVFVGDELAGLVVLDAHDPLKPKRVAATAIPGRAHSLAASGDLVFIAAQYGGLQIVSAADPKNPIYAGGVSWNRNALRVAASGRAAYVVSEDGLRVVDAADPSAPKIVKTITGNFIDAAVSGTNLCAVGPTNITMFNLDSPLNPLQFATRKTVQGSSAIVATATYFFVSNPSLSSIFAIGKTNELAATATLQGGSDEALAVSDNPDRIFAASGSNLSEVDFANPSSPVVTLPYHRIEFVGAVALAGTNALVIDGDFKTLDVLDIADPAKPAQISRWPLPANLGSWNGLVTRGKLAYVALEPVFVVVDFSDPKNLRQVSSIPIAHASHSVTLHDNYAYVLATELGLQIIDISNPLQPKIVSVTRLANAADHVAFIGETAVVALVEGGVALLDVSDPANPRLRQTMPEYATCLAVATRGNLGCIATGFAVALVDFGDLDHPLEVSRFNEPSGLAGIQLLDDKLFVGSYAGHHVLDISAPAKPRLIATAPFWQLLTGRSGQYVCNITGEGIRIVDLNALANPQSLSQTATTNDTLRVTVQRRNAFLSTGARMQTVDIANSYQPAVRSDIPILQSNLFVQGNYVYTVGKSFQIVDVSNPARPRVLSIISIPGSNVVAVGKYAYVANDGNSPLTTINITNKTDPFVVGHPAVNGTVLRAANGFLYSIRLSGVSILDLEDPAAPRIVGEFTGLQVYQKDLAVAGSWLYMVGDGGWQVIDVSDPKKPWQIAQRDEITGKRIAVVGNRAYVLTDHGGLQVFDVSNPGYPKLVGGNASLNATDLYASEDTLYAVGAEGLTILDLYYLATNSPHMTMLSPIDETAGRLRIRGPSGWVGKIERSSDFTGWTAWQDVLLDVAPLEIRDEGVAPAKKFYRAVAR